MHYCYILYSPAIDRYYIGETENLENRIEQHYSGFFKKSFTKQTNDWRLKLALEIKDRTTAKKLERYIKSKKSRKYIEYLIVNESFRSELLAKFI